MGQTWKFGEGAATKAWRAVLSGGFSPFAKLDVKLSQIYVQTNFKIRGILNKRIA